MFGLKVESSNLLANPREKVELIEAKVESSMSKVEVIYEKVEMFGLKVESASFISRFPRESRTY
ncbi:hypothetical protein MKY27_05195 [Solibacillus sp. FSL R5-0449]|uniref:hypothetical protein n=1 Tax=Solibacillus sp. FSL R5-0449 TaxID=2921639 RepID=UPI0030CE2AFC